MPMPVRIGRFEVERLLGRGGQSAVFLARDPMLDRLVAIKTLPYSSPAQCAALLCEARLTGKLKHPHIVPVFDAGEHDGYPYIVFEYVEGETLAALLRREGAIPADRAVKIMAAVLDALAHAHAAGIIHRDLKPANILVADDYPRVMDFGIALAIGDIASGYHDLAGTPAYMAPEYVRDGRVNAQNDLFAAGLILAELLTGTRIVAGDSGLQALHALASRPVELPPPTTHPFEPALRPFLERSIAAEPAARFANATAMRDALLEERARAARPDAATPEAGAGGTAAAAIDFLLRRMRTKRDFPALSASIDAVNRALKAETENVSRLSNTILQDFALTNRLLRLVNSTAYRAAGSGNISTVTRAVQILGYNQVRSLAVTLMVFEHLQNRGQAQSLQNEFAVTLLSGVMARSLAGKSGVRDAEEAFVCAMFHELGRMLCIFYFPEEWDEIRRMTAEEKLPLELAARRVLGAGFSDLGSGTARLWGFPDRLVHSMRPLDEEPRRKAAGAEKALRIVASCTSSLARTLAETPRADWPAAIANVAHRYRNALPVEGDALSTLVSRAIDDMQEFAAAAQLNLSRSSFAKSLNEWMRDPGNAQAAGSAPTVSVIDLVAMPRGDSAPASDAGDGQAVLSSGIQDLSNALVDGVPLNEVLRIALETIYRGLGFRRVLLAVRDPKAGMITGRFGFGEEVQETARRFRFPVAFQADVFHAALDKNADILISDVDDPAIAARIPPWYREAIGARNFLLLPLVINGKPFGIIYADASQAGSITISPNGLKLLRTLRNQTLLAIKHAM